MTYTARYARRACFELADLGRAGYAPVIAGALDKPGAGEKAINAAKTIDGCERADFAKRDI